MTFEHVIVITGIVLLVFCFVFLDLALALLATLFGLLTLANVKWNLKKLRESMEGIKHRRFNKKHQ